jgi:hypothetical protein
MSGGEHDSGQVVGVVLRLAVFKIVYFAVLIGALMMWADYDEVIASSIREGWFPASEADWLAGVQTGPGKHFSTWDAAHYLVLSKVGYFKELKSSAFYPLWPLLVRWLSMATGISFVLSGTVLSNLLSLMGWTLFWRLLSKNFGESVARWAIAFLLAFPGSLFYQFNYSESLFLLLVMMLWLGLEKPRPAVAWVAAFCLPLTRAVGLFAVLPVLWQEVKRWRKSERDRRAKAGLLVAAPLLGWLLYIGFMWNRTGDPFHGFAAQKHWKAHSIGNLWDVPKFVFEFFQPTSWHDFRGSLLDRCGFLLVAYAVAPLWRADKGLLVWLFVLAIIPAMSGTFVSFIRFESTAFPVFVALGLFFSKEENRWLGRALLAAMAGAHAVLLWRFVNYGWAA